LRCESGPRPAAPPTFADDPEQTFRCFLEIGEVAAAVVFLASDEASFVNGNALYVDNGWHVKG